MVLDDAQRLKIECKGKTDRSSRQHSGIDTMRCLHIGRCFLQLSLSETAGEVASMILIISMVLITSVLVALGNFKTRL